MMQLSPKNTDEKLLADQAARNWARFWEDVTAVAPSSVPTGSLNRLKRFLRRAGGLELAYRLVSRELGNAPHRKVLEAGCGTGEISLRFARAGERLFMLDTSEAAVSFCKTRAEATGLSVAVVRGSIFDLPFKEGSFGAIFNVGVLDHFGPEYRQRAVKEVARTLEAGGRAALLTNSARSIIHPIAMKSASKRGRWPFGFKDAVESLLESAQNGESTAPLREYSRGFVSQFEFLHYCLPGGHRTKRVFLALFYLISLPFSLLNRFPGQYLVSIMDKNHKGATADVRSE
jgi:SAM-dependent methyltransferase